MSKEADRYYYDAFPVTLNIGEETRYEYITNAFDAGVDSTNKRISDVNNYYKQLEGMSEEYQKGYIQAEKDMPKQFEAVHDIIRLQKRIDELEAKNKWHDLVVNPNDLPDTEREVILKLYDKGQNQSINIIGFKSLNPKYIEKHGNWISVLNLDILDLCDVIAWKEID